MNAQFDLIQEVDPELSLVRNIHHGNHDRSQVYLVKKKGILYVLRTGFRGMNGANSYRSELEALKRAGQYPRIPGVAHLVYDYGNGLLKEYVEGPNIMDVSKGKADGWQYRKGKFFYRGSQVAREEDVRQQLSWTVSELHERGVGGLNLFAEDVVITPSGQIYLFDFDSSTIDSSDDVPAIMRRNGNGFQEFVDLDLFCLRKLFSLEYPPEYFRWSSG